MKTKRRRKKPIDKPISEERALKLSNDLSEGVRSGTIEEWRSVARYWRGQADRHANNLSAIRPSIAALLTAWAIQSHARLELADWLNIQTAQDP